MDNSQEHVAEQHLTKIKGKSSKMTAIWFQIILIVQIIKQASNVHNLVVYSDGETGLFSTSLVDHLHCGKLVNQ